MHWVYKQDVKKGAGSEDIAAFTCLLPVSQCSGVSISGWVSQARVLRGAHRLQGEMCFLVIPCSVWASILQLCFRPGRCSVLHRQQGSLKQRSGQGAYSCAFGWLEGRCRGWCHWRVRIPTQDSSAGFSVLSSQRQTHGWSCFKINCLFYYYFSS